MKNFLIILLGLSIGLIVGYFIYGPNSYGQEKLSTTEKESFISFKGGPDVGINRGGPITANQANVRLNGMRKWRDKLLNKKKVEVSSGYSFGLNPLKELIKKIDTLNKYHMHEPGNPITGVRAHLSLIDTVDQNTNKRYKYLDVFLSPVQKNGRNYVYFDEKINEKNDNFIERENLMNFDGSGLILNQSNPCPEYCDEPGLRNNESNR